MPTKITFKIATKQGPIEKTGYVANFKIGSKTVKFVLQDGIGESCALTHYASGMIAVHENTVAARKVSHYMASPYSTPLTNRAACAELLDEIIKNLGAEELLKKLEAATVINS